jgi:hypothetical protein
MNNIKKKNLILASSKTVNGKLNIKRLSGSTNKKSLVIDTNRSSTNTFPIVKTNNSKRNDVSETKEPCEEKKSLMNTFLSKTNTESIMSDGIKTAQINVVARFRPINFVEEVYYL